MVSFGVVVGNTGFNINIVECKLYRRANSSIRRTKF